MKKLYKQPTKTELRIASSQSKIAISSWIKTSRTSLQLTQENLAEIAGLDRKTINRIENGHFSPSVDTLIRISFALDSKIPMFV